MTGTPPGVDDRERPGRADRGDQATNRRWSRRVPLLPEECSDGALAPPGGITASERVAEVHGDAAVVLDEGEGQSGAEVLEAVGARAAVEFGGLGVARQTVEVGVTEAAVPLEAAAVPGQRHVARAAVEGEAGVVVGAGDAVGFDLVVEEEHLADQV